MTELSHEERLELDLKDVEFELRQIEFEREGIEVARWRKLKELSRRQQAAFEQKEQLLALQRGEGKNE